MVKTIFEEIGGTYTQCGDYFLPNLVLPQEKETSEPIGAWERKHLDYLKQYKRILYINLMTSGRLHSYLADIDNRATALYYRTVSALATEQGVTEELKSENQMLWVQKMNAIGSAATGIVNSEIIFV